MGKWCGICYRNEIYNDWWSCNEDCPVFGKDFEELAKIIIVMKDRIEEVISMMKSAIK